MKRIVRNQFTYEEKRRKAKKITMPKSLTIPGQETKLRTILEQHSRGMALPPDKEGQYFGEVDVPDFEGMDLVDLMEYTKELKDTITEMQVRVKEETKIREEQTKKELEKFQKVQDFLERNPEGIQEKEDKHGVS